MTSDVLACIVCEAIFFSLCIAWIISMREPRPKPPPEVPLYLRENRVELGEDGHFHIKH